jgi:uncharacterized membrane protein YphA (DoxX/SURF4 family)
MEGTSIRKYFLHTVTYLYILLWTYAAISKLKDVDKFYGQVSQSPMLTPFATIAVWTIPTLEILLAVLLISGKHKRFALYASYSLMTLFCFYIIGITEYSPYVPCSCGGILEHMTWSQHLYFNLLFCLLAAMAILTYNRIVATTGDAENLTKE